MKKTFFTLLLSLLSLGLFLFTSPAVFAQTPTSAANSTTDTSPQALPRNTNPDVPNNLHTYTQSTFIEILSSASCMLTGHDPLQQNGKCLGIDPQTRKIGYVESGSGGVLGIVPSLIGSTFSIPVSSSQYGSYLASNFGITKKTYAQVNVDDPKYCASNPEVCRACRTDPKPSYCVSLGEPSQGIGQGVGFQGLRPALTLWKTFRNLVYLLFVFIFVILGLGIMFRINIDARTVMTVQNQIPKIIIALILITFSYAIAGFLIDLMYLSMYLIVNIFVSQGFAIGTNFDTNPVNAAGGFGGISHIATPAAKSVAGILSSLFDGGIGETLGRTVVSIIGALIGKTIGNGIGGFFGTAGPAVGSLVGTAGGAIAGFALGTKVLGVVALIIAYIVIAVAILTALLRLWFTLIKAYVFIFLGVVLAPLWIVIGLFPGGAGFGPWIRNLLANLAAFPTVLVLFALGKILQDGFEHTSNAFVPPFIGDPGNGGLLGAIIGMGIILITPEALNITKNIFKAPDLKYTAAVGKALSSGQKIAGYPFAKTWEHLKYVNPMDSSRGGFVGIRLANMEGKRGHILRGIFGVHQGNH